MDSYLRAAMVLFLRKYTTTGGDDLELLWSDLSEGLWGPNTTTDPGLWFDWVHAYWSARGVSFATSTAVKGLNSVEIAGRRETLNVLAARNSEWIDSGTFASESQVGEIEGLAALRTIVDSEYGRGAAGIMNLIASLESGTTRIPDGLSG